MKNLYVNAPQRSCHHPSKMDDLFANTHDDLFANTNEDLFAKTNMD
ncbi:hypothetical protein [Sphingobacterium mizutaii]